MQKLPKKRKKWPIFALVLLTKITKKPDILEHLETFLRQIEVSIEFSNIFYTKTLLSCQQYCFILLNTHWKTVKSIFFKELVTAKIFWFLQLFYLLDKWNVNIVITIDSKLVFFCGKRVAESDADFSLPQNRFLNALKWQFFVIFVNQINAKIVTICAFLESFLHL